MQSKLLFICFIISIFLNTTAYADDIWFLFPRDGQPVTGKINIKIQPPHRVPVYVWIEEEKTEQLVWHATFLPENEYMLTVDTTRFKAGAYEINAEYYLDGEDYDGDIDIWVNSP